MLYDSYLYPSLRDTINQSEQFIELDPTEDLNPYGFFLGSRSAESALEGLFHRTFQRWTIPSPSTSQF